MVPARPGHGRLSAREVRRRRAPAPVAVPERAGGPFDIDLGTNRSGSTYAVYTRDGDIYRLGVASGVETKITKLSSPTLAERDPTIQRGEIAFIRRDGGYDQLRIGDTTSGSTGSRFLVKKRSIAGAELAIKQVAYVEQSGASLLVHVRNISSGHDQVVYRATSGGANESGVTRPGYDAETNAFVWARTNIGSGAGNRIVRYTLPGSKLSLRPGLAALQLDVVGRTRSSARPRPPRWTPATALAPATTPGRTTATSR